MADEKPFVEETPEEPEKETQVDIEGLVKELQAAQITDPEKLKGHLTNARDYGRMQSERDRLAQELQSIRSEISEFKNYAHKPVNDEYGNESRPIDIEEVVAKAIRKEKARELEMQRQSQAQIAKVWNKISNDENFHLVKDEFEGALRDPVTMFKLQTGEIEATELYHKMVANKFKGYTKKALDALQTFQGAGTVKPPHIESNARVGTQKVEEKTDKQKKIEDILKKPKNKVKEQDIDDVIGMALGDVFR
jgi:hypothetical protein